MKSSKIILIFLVFVSQIVSAQLVGHQDITLPTPSIGSSITNYDVEGSNLAYGIASPSINLFTIQLEEIAVSITLSHSYNGYKPNELPGVSGLGWTISGGGALVKNIHGLDDDIIHGYPGTVENYMSQCSTAAQLSSFVSSKLSEPGYELDHFKRLIANGQWDGLPDKYVVFGPNLNENFFQYRRSMFATFPHSATTIGRGSVGKEWVVTNGNGVKYFYSEPNRYDETDNLVHPTTGTNTWQLVKIQSGNGESIEYNFGLPKQEERYQYRDAIRYGTEAGQTTIKQDFLNALNYSSYSSSLLESIKCSNYKLTYHYSSFIVASDYGDSIKLSQLDSIRIVDNENKTFKVISFIYKELHNSFFLEEVKIKGQNHEVIENYQFTYNESMSRSYAYPSRNMDHWGYANGNNGNYLFPKIIKGIELQYGGNREANYDESQFGLLNSMRLPTGGTIKYEYEKNRTVEKGIEEIDMSPYSIHAACNISCRKITETCLIRIPFDQEIKLQYHCTTDSLGIPWPLTCDGMGIKIYDVLENIYFSDINITENEDVSTTVFLKEGDYILEIYSGDKGFKINATVTQKDCLKDENGNCIEVDKDYDVGGYRLKRITQTPIFGSNIVSDILYNKSGALFGSPKYETNSSDFKYAYDGNYCSWPMLEETGSWTTRTGNSYEPLLRGGNPIMYTKVSIETLSIGKVIKSTYDYVYHSKDGGCSNGSFYADRPDKRGQVKNQFLYLDGNSEPIKKTENFFKDILPENEKAVIAIHQDFSKAGSNTWDTKYKEGSWCPVNDVKNILDSSIITQDNVTIKKAFTYNNNGLLESEKYLNSKGEIVNTKYSYSTSFKSKPVLIEQEVNGRIISGEKSEYNNYGQPLMISNYYNGIGYIKTKEIIYETFNNVLDGSIISKPVQQIDYGIEDTPKSVMSQAWAYSNSYPVIKAQNVSYADLDNAVKTANIGNYENLDNFLLGVGAFFDNNGSFNIANKEAYTSFVNEVQETLPEAFITFYTYSPLRGLTSQTDQNGQTIYYQFDNFGRLSDVIDHNGNILKNYEYNYAH